MMYFMFALFLQVYHYIQHENTYHHKLAAGMPSIIFCTVFIIEINDTYIEL